MIRMLWRIKRNNIPVVQMTNCCLNFQKTKHSRKQFWKLWFVKWHVFGTCQREDCRSFPHSLVFIKFMMASNLTQQELHCHAFNRNQQLSEATLFTLMTLYNINYIMITKIYEQFFTNNLFQSKMLRNS